MQHVVTTEKNRNQPDMLGWAQLVVWENEINSSTPEVTQLQGYWMIVD